MIAIVAGTKATEVAGVLRKIPARKRDKVKEVTLDMSRAMESIVTQAFPKATVVTDRFHAQQLVSEALQDMRVALRRETLKQENEAIKEAREKRTKYTPIVYNNGDTTRQLLARSRYLLFKPSTKWTASQKLRADIVFKEYPKLKSAYNLSMMFRSCYENSGSIPEAKKKLQQWYEKVAAKNIESFNVAAESI